MTRLSFPAAALALLVASSLGAQPKPFTWPTSTPQKLGLNAAVLDSLHAEITAGKYGNIDRMLVIRRGTIVMDKTYARDYDGMYGDSARSTSTLNNSHDPTGPFNYFNPWWHPTYRRGTLHTLQSVSKTVASAVIGAAVTRGDFPDLNTPILKYWDTTTVANLDDRKRRITIRHLLTMSGGFDWNESIPYSDPNNTAGALEASPDWVKFTIDRPMMREPGTTFNYSSGESALLAHIFFRATGMDIEEYAARHLFTPLGITNWQWKRTPSGTIDTEGGLYLEARDLARIWQLWLQGGRWNGATVVSEQWVRESVTPHIPTSARAGAPQYGYKWWLYSNPVQKDKLIWAGSGFGGQFPMAFPDQEMVVVFNAWNITGPPSLPLRAVQERLIKAAK
ncbi:serine hydrolase domain-containing protein [Gemmatimonas phototrophica]|uniref:serine hydrolase domain-containing protein n=1 Tax=Gemmatimonas phototrophica TaxID=1379270 RepID=UPI0006A74F89|nr:serine hydrolase [Gemmatimonas phototrophica]